MKMEKGSGKCSKLCCLTSLLVSIWVLLLYSYFIALRVDINHSTVVVTSTRMIKYNITTSNNTDQPAAAPPPPRKPLSSYPFARALKTAENKSDPCNGKYLYIHKLPSRFNEDMVKDCKSLNPWSDMCESISNDGMGPPLLLNQQSAKIGDEDVFSETGWYATNQFALDLIFSRRMSHYSCLTSDSTIASAIFIPFFAGFDIARHLWGHNISSRDAASFDLLNWLNNTPEWKFMNGKDHFMVAGRTTWDLRRLTDDESNWGNKLMRLPAIRNITTLVIESSPWHSNDMAIPYPTYFHPQSDSEILIWMNRMRKMKRISLFSFAGAARPGDPNSIRTKIINQCRNSNSTCKLLECGVKDQSKCHSPTNVMNMFQTSHFCIQPQGDSYTRRSSFDSMLAGCIPVFFHPGSAYVQYTWHLPKNYTAYSVFIPEDDVRLRNVSIEERLKRIPIQQVKVMRENVIDLIPQLVYADPSRSNNNKLEMSMRDAFDVAVQGVIDKVTNLRWAVVNGTLPEEFAEDDSWKYALLEPGQKKIGPHHWEPYFSKAKHGDR